MVLLPDGTPAVGVDVALYDSNLLKLKDGNDIAWTRTGRNGAFKFKIRNGNWGISVNHPQFRSPTAGLVSLGSRGRVVLPFDLRLERGGVVQEGTVISENGRPFDTTLCWIPVSSVSGLRIEAARFVRTHQGRFRTVLEPGHYGFQVFPVHDGNPWELRQVGPAAEEIRLMSRRPPYASPRDVRNWIREHAQRFETLDPAMEAPGTTGLEALAEGSTLLGLGEAAHGTSEFPRLKHSIVHRFLSGGTFQALAIEMDLEEGFNLDDFLQGASNGCFESLNRQFRTPEFLALLLDLRRLNDSLPKEKKVRLHGINIDRPRKSFPEAHRWFMKVDPFSARILDRELRDLAETEMKLEGVGEAVAARAEAWGRAVQDLLGRMENLESTWIRKAGRVAFERQRLRLRYFQRYIAPAALGILGDSHREGAMADNILDLLQGGTPDVRVLVWAHNSHLTRVPIGRLGCAPMGCHLANALGSGYRSLAFLFHDGEVLAASALPGASGVRTFELPGRPDATLGEAFHRASEAPVQFLDFRWLPAYGKVRAWFDTCQMTWCVPEGLDPRIWDAYLVGERFTEGFDGIVFVDRVSAVGTVANTAGP